MFIQSVSRRRSEDMLMQSVSRQFTNQLQGLLNKYSVDSLVNVHDFVLAHTIQKFLNVLAWQNAEEVRLKGSGMEDEII